MTKRTLITAGTVGAAALLFASSAFAVTLNFDGSTTISSNNPHTGASGSVLMSLSDVSATVVQVDMSVRNTTGEIAPFGAGATESMLTGFGFDLLDGVSFGSLVTAGTYLDKLISPADFNPFDDLDVGFADNTNFLGGNANDALPEATTDSIVFTLDLGTTGLDASSLDLLLQTSFDAGTLQAGMRFQQVNAGAGSDKLEYTGTVVPQAPVPLPAAGWAMLAALGGLGAMRRRKAAS